jgi:hypothetical protein
MLVAIPANATFDRFDQRKRKQNFFFQPRSVMFTTVKRSAFILLFLALWLFGGITGLPDAHASIPNPSIGVFRDGLSGRRLYDPMIGRFVTADPLGFADGPNRYAYVGNRPLVFIDADGRLAKGAGYGLKDLAVGTGQLFWNLGGSLGYGAVSIFDYELAEAIYGNQAQGLRNFGYGMGGLAWNVGGGIGYAVTWGIDPEYARNVYGEQTAGLQEAAIAMSGGEGQSGAFRTGYVGSQIAAVYLLGKYGNQPIGAKSVPSNWNPLNGPGPIGEEAAATFRSASYTETVTSEATTLYRVYGGKAGELASYWTRIPPAGPLQAMIDSALNPAWGNTAQNVATIRVPAGTTIYEGFAAPQGGLLGGGSQVYIPKVNPDWLAYP